MVAEARTKGIVLCGNEVGQTVPMDANVPNFDLASLRDLRETFAPLAVDAFRPAKTPDERPPSRSKM